MAFDQRNQIIKGDQTNVVGDYIVQSHDTIKRINADIEKLDYELDLIIANNKFPTTKLFLFVSTELIILLVLTTVLPYGYSGILAFIFIASAIGTFVKLNNEHRQQLKLQIEPVQTEIEQLRSKRSREESKLAQKAQ